ncbi:MAG: cytochrome c [Acidimicrobiales bacterium]
MRRSRWLPIAVVLTASVAGAAACSSGPARPSDAVLGKGYDVYTARCASCHGVNGEGGIGPPMKGVTGRISVDKHTETVRKGRSGTAMPAFEDQLTDEDIQAVVRYEREVLGATG